MHSSSARGVAIGARTPQLSLPKARRCYAWRPRNGIPLAAAVASSCGRTISPPQRGNPTPAATAVLQQLLRHHEHGNKRPAVDGGRVPLQLRRRAFAVLCRASGPSSAKQQQRTAPAAASGSAAALWQQDGPQSTSPLAAAGDHGEAEGAAQAGQHSAPEPASAPVVNVLRRSGSERNLLERMKEIVQLSLPLTLTNVSGFTLNCLSDAMIGRLGATALSTTTLANSLYGMMGISIIWGGAAGMETLAGQAYGARNFRMMRLVLFRAMVVCWALCVPIALVWQHAEWLLIKLGQCPVMSATGALYLQALVPSLFVYVLAECMQSYFVCQNNVQPATWAKGITALLGPVFYYLLMFKMNLGLTGAAYAYALCKLANAGLLIAWMVWERYQGTGAEQEEQQQQQHQPEASSGSSSGSGGGAPSAFTSSSTTTTTGAVPITSSPQQTAASQHSSADQGALHPAGTAAAAVGAGGAAVAALSVVPDISLGEVLDLKGCWEYIKYGFPSAMMTMLEWWAYELNVILAGTLPNAEVAVAVLGICLAISGWVYMFPQSIATAATARVSNALGAGDARLARAYFRSALLMVAAQQAVLAAGVLSCSTHVVQFFCQDPEVLGVAMGIVPIVACNILSDGMNVVLNGVLRACGRQALGARLQLCSYWLVGVPLSWFLGVKSQLGIAGFLTAVGCTSFTQAIVCATIISRFNWHEEVKRSQQILEDMSATMDTSKAPA